MKLRKGVEFHDGSSFDAESLKYQIEWIKDKANGAWSSAWIAPVVSIEVVDKYTVKWTFNKAWAAFPGIMANVPGYAMSAKALKEKGPKGLDNHAIGTGRFMVEKGSPGNYLKIKRNPNWWFGQSIGMPDMPYFDGWHISVIPDASVRLANLRAGKVDSISIAPHQYNMLKNDPKLNVPLVNQNWMTSVNFNHAKGPCKDIRVRKAISHALDRKALIVGTMFGLGREASCMFPGDHWGHNPDLKPVSYDPELSRKLLAKAGYPNGLTVTGYAANDNTSRSVALAVKNMLEEVGIKWQVDFLEAAARSDRLKNLEFEVTLGGWTWIWDPDLMPTGLYHPDGGFNYGRTNNKKAIELILAGRTEVDVSKRQRIYWDLEKVVYDNYEDAWMWWAVSPIVFSKKIKGWNTEMYLEGREGFWFSHPRWFEDGRP
jgi:peptide/nickel transport system substrate-binding protein